MPPWRCLSGRFTPRNSQFLLTSPKVKSRFVFLILNFKKREKKRKRKIISLLLIVCAYWGGSVSHQIMLRAEKTAEKKISAMLRTAVRVSMQGLLNKCNLVYLAEWGMKDFSPILHNSLWGGPWNNFESTSNNCFAQRVILVSGVTRVQSAPMCSSSCNFDNKQLFVFLWYILKNK